MTRTMHLLLVLLAWSSLGVGLGAVPGGPTNSCSPEKMTMYKMVLHTYWTREKFPKHYPDWRPPAQWSKTIGMSHSNTHTLFRLGQVVSSGVREYAETGKVDSLLSGSWNSSVMDVFIARAIPQGPGVTDTKFYVDGNHTRVSAIARLVPSPDWFVGIDSFDLCVDGNWLDTITIEADPIDAGTDNGFTFTAPNWQTAPQGVAYRMTSQYPAHPASSFYYPHMRRLPPIATFQFIKMREYELTEVFHHSDDEHRYDVLQLERLAHNTIDVLDGNRALSVSEEVERMEEAEYQKENEVLVRGRDGKAKSTPDNKYISSVLNSASKDYFLPTYGSKTSAISSTTPEPRSANEVAAGDTSSIYDAIAHRYRTRTRNRRRKSHSNSMVTGKPSLAEKPSRQLHARRIRPSSDCRVSSWGEWSACSRACGVGETRRRRRVLRPARGAGRPCPPLTQTRWCGSAAGCVNDTDLFKW